MINSKRGNCKVHTFGIGKGVSTELIIECAKAGNGSHVFIDDLQEIESKVLAALEKNMFPYTIIKKLTLLDENKEKLHTIKDVGYLCHNVPFKYLNFIASSTLNPL